MRLNLLHEVDSDESLGIVVSESESEYEEVMVNTEPKPKASFLSSLKSKEKI
jgi:hypothetical protein